ncbi:MAG TPA: hypothetical protein VJ548_13045 [Azospira sp.]|nr:hypothetical protein [Azospira sp.]
MSARTAPDLSPAVPARRPSLVLVLLLLLFALPFPLAASLHLAGWRPATSASHGELLQPPQPLPASGLTLADGRSLPTSALAGRWQLVLAGNGPCEADCQASLAALAQVQRLLPKYQARIGRLWLAPAHGIENNAPASADTGGLVAASMDAAWIAQLQPPTAGYRFYLADPAGRLMLRYAPDADPAGLRQDLERLLKYSWIG